MQCMVNLECLMSTCFFSGWQLQMARNLATMTYSCLRREVMWTAAFYYQQLWATLARRSPRRSQPRRQWYQFFLILLPTRAGSTSLLNCPANLIQQIQQSPSCTRQMPSQNIYRTCLTVPDMKASCGTFLRCSKQSSRRSWRERGSVSSSKSQSLSRQRKQDTQKQKTQQARQGRIQQCR